MRQEIRKINEFAIYKTKYGFIVHNTKVDFDKAHCHINTYTAAVSIAKLASKKTNAT